MTSAAALKSRIESALGGPYLAWREQPVTEFLPSGIPELDAVTGGLPRGAITDLYGPASSGRTSVLMAALAEATARQEVSAVIDASDAFDPASAAAAGVHLERLLWVRCGRQIEREAERVAGQAKESAGRLSGAAQALKVADLLIQAGGFGLIALDLGDLSPSLVSRIPLASWYRFRHAVENTPAVVLVLERQPSVKSCAALLLEARKNGIAWSGAPGCSQLLRGLRLDLAPRKPVARESVSFDAQALG